MLTRARATAGIIGLALLLTSGPAGAQGGGTLHRVTSREGQCRTESDGEHRRWQCQEWFYIDRQGRRLRRLVTP